MKTGDSTFDDIYISKETGKVVGVVLDGQDYKLVPFNDMEPKSISHFEVSYSRFVALMLARGLFIVEANKRKAMELVDWIYGKEDEK